MICNVVGARPNFMKMAPIVLEMAKRGIPQFFVHTGQHYDKQLSGVFFEDLGLPAPDVFLRVGSGTHAKQTADIMTSFEKVCLERDFDLVVVGGDVNSTLACALVAAKLGIPVGHVEAGLRSFDRTMPEEINRIMTDHLAQFLFTTEESANYNLANEGISGENIYFVGNTMVDTLIKHKEPALTLTSWEDYGLRPHKYGLLTLHRPSNVDDSMKLKSILSIINEISHDLPILFPVHPRTQSKMLINNIPLNNSLMVVEPLSYLVFISLMAKARFVLTDSGGIQEETTILHIPCLTLRENTERPITLTLGTNNLIGTEAENIRKAVSEIVSKDHVFRKEPPLWDGEASVRIVNIIEEWVLKRTF